MQTFIILAIIFAVALSQTVINIHNGGSASCNKNRPRPRVISPFYNGPNDMIFPDGSRHGVLYDFWNEITRINPLFPRYIATAITTGNVYDDLYGYLVDDLADINVESAPLTGGPVKASIPFVPFVARSPYLFATNLPNNGGSTQDCNVLPNCVDKGWCSGQTYESIAEYSKNNGDIPIVFSFIADSGYDVKFEQLKSTFLSLGVKNVTADAFYVPNILNDLFSKIMEVGNTLSTKEIRLITFQYDNYSSACQSFTQGYDFPDGFSLTIIALDINNDQFGLALNPNIDAYIENELNQALRQIIDEKFLCKLAAAYGGLCDDHTVFNESPENYCSKVNWPDLPPCTPFKRNSDRNSISNLLQFDRHFNLKSLIHKARK